MNLEATDCLGRALRHKEILGAQAIRSSVPQADIVAGSVVGRPVTFLKDSRCVLRYDHHYTASHGIDEVTHGTHGSDQETTEHP